MSDKLLWKNISVLPYFRAFLRAVEGRFYSEIDIENPILDIGCGDGFFAYCSFDFRLRCGIDPDLTSLKEAKKLNVYDNLICAKGDQLPLRNAYFRTVISNSVLEHVINVEVVLKEIYRVLRSRSDFIFCVPNTQFSENLSLARFMEKINLVKIAVKYRKIFNKISRHRNIDDLIIWKERLNNVGFKIYSSWNYFSPRALRVLEWGHILGVPAWISKKIFGKWILVPRMWNLKIIYTIIENIFISETKTDNGAYSFYIARK